LSGVLAIPTSKDNTESMQGKSSITLSSFNKEKYKRRKK
jgi:hypothetical protein